MTDKEINLKIMLALGWVMYRTEYPQRWRGPDGTDYGIHPPYVDYANDLNAMHEAEKTLVDWRRYGIELAKLLKLYDGDEWPGIQPGRVGEIAHASAAQRAEAFLRTLKKWEE